ncbi:uncharacterized protein LOC141673665 [Apium graveolens]|uniref:uncharacterized protein LOC141673665 n=1 Tax=Apium graveolens TaxID=4045 RepID=UPI003D7B245F
MGILDPDRVGEDQNIFQVFEGLFASRRNDQCAQIGLVCWGLWHRRNLWVWEHKNMSMSRLKYMVQSMLQEWKEAQKECYQHMTELQVQVWRKPPPGWVKINVDASCRADKHYVGAGWVIRDEKGGFLRAKTSRIMGRLQAREAEAWSFKEALKWTHSWRAYKCVFELDAKEVVEAINGSNVTSYFHFIIDECKDVL